MVHGPFHLQGAHFTGLWSAVMKLVLFKRNWSFLIAVLLFVFKEFRIRSVEANIESLKKSVATSKQRLAATRNNINKNHQNKSECLQRQRKLSDKITEARQYLIRRNLSIGKLRESKDKVDSYIADLVQKRVQQLATYIFAIETRETVGEGSGQSTASSSESTPLLQPISDSNSFTNFHSNYTVVEPWISGNGDYSAFALYGNYSVRDLC